MSLPPRTRLSVSSLALGGDGIAHVGEGQARRAIFVPGGVPGDVVLATVDLARRPARAIDVAVVEPSTDRVVPPCRELARCGGCDLMHLSARAQVAAHAEMVRSALAHVVPALPEVVTHPAKETERYRTRTRLAVRTTGRRVEVGYRPPRSHEVHDVGSCLVLDVRLEPVLPALRELLAGERGHGEASIALGAGGLPVLELRWTGELGGAVFAALEAKVASGALAGADVWLEGARSRARIGDPTGRTLAADGAPITLPSAGFAQVHAATSAELGARAVELLGAEGEDAVELFAGSGNFTVLLARVARTVVAVESASDAVEAARHNLAARALSAKIVCADADAFELPRKARRVLLDPPRAGAPGASAEIARSRASVVVYASCDPGTLARDVATLAAARFAPTHVETFEMFPHTSHVETLVRLERKRAGA